jgi:IS30 family transposase
VSNRNRRRSPDGWPPSGMILRTSLTSDQDRDARDSKQVSVATDNDIYFSDPRAPWQDTPDTQHTVVR